MIRSEGAATAGLDRWLAPGIGRAALWKSSFFGAPNPGGPASSNPATPVK
jgi:hypothetical protein